MIDELHAHTSRACIDALEAPRLAPSIAAIPMPARIARLPRDRRGFPVPWFVATIDGVPDFRVIAPGRLARAHNGRRCWICGEPLGKWLAFVIGPMCAVNRISSEPPSHRDCAEYAAVACPFLAHPKMTRREGGIPADVVPAAGNGIRRNPGVALVWITTSYEIVRLPDGFLFGVGDPVSVGWYAEGRRATRAEVEESIRTGLPLLRADAERESAAAVAALERMTAEARELLPHA